MGGVHGVKNAGLILDVLSEGGNVADKMIRQEGTFFTKISHMSALFDEVLALTSLDTKELVAEFKELDEDDLKQVHARFQAKFDIADDKVEEIVEEGLELARALGSDVVKVVAWVKKIQAAVESGKTPEAAPAV